MSVRNGLALLVALSTLLFLAACGSSSNSASAPPSGGYNTSSLSGTYVVSLSGQDITNGVQSFFALVGALTANNGSLTGTIDIADPSLAAATGASTPVQTAVAASGSFSITADGRGRGVISFPFNGQSSQIGIDFVLSSSSGGLITRFDVNGTGSGTFDLQSNVTQANLGSYAFSLSGVDEGEINPFGMVGEFTVGSTGSITGLQDINDDGNSSGLTNLGLGGSVTLASSGPGTAQLATGTGYGTLAFDVWPIDSTHLKLIETDGFLVTAGDAFTQQTSISAGQLVYTMSGLDSGGLFASGGIASYDGSLNLSSGFEAMNDSALTSIAQSITVSGTLAATGSTGRYQLNFAGFYNGDGGAVSSPTFAAYPSTSGILLLEIDDGGVTAGTAFQQTATTLATSQGYSLNLTGANPDGEVDDIAEFVVDSSTALSNGLIDENDEGTLNFDQQLGQNGVYNYAGTGYGSISYPSTDNTLIGTLNLGFFVANSSTVIFIDTDAGAQTGLGVFQPQAASGASPGLAHTMSHLGALRASSLMRAHQKKKQ
jgi:hypothetical protein